MRDFCGAIVQQFIYERTRNHCQNTGHVCPHWIDGKIYEDLVSLDKKDGGSRINEYLERTHRVEVTMIPGAKPEDMKFKIECVPYAIWKTDTCDYKNEEAEESMRQEYLENTKEEGQNAPM